MKSTIYMEKAAADDLKSGESEVSGPCSGKPAAAIMALEAGVYAALETYSNVHRGSGHYSMVTTRLFEKARSIVLEYLRLRKAKYVVIFCTTRQAEVFLRQVKPDAFMRISGMDIGLALGVTALAIKRKALRGGIPFQAGGGTARLVSPDWVIWAKKPDRYEPGTPAIINIIAFAHALLLTGRYGKGVFMNTSAVKMTAKEILYHDNLSQYSGKVLLEELKNTFIGRNVLVPSMEGQTPFVNLDNSASTPAFRAVWDSVRLAWSQPVEVHKDIISEVRAVCAEAMGVSLNSYNIIFTSNTTEAINIAAESFCRESEPDIEPVVLNSLMEHNSNELPWRMGKGISLIRLSVSEEGFIHQGELEELLCGYNRDHLHGSKRIKLVAVSGASNVLGVFNDLKVISGIVHRYGARLLVDGAQMTAHRKVEIENCGIDYFAFSAHKIYAPFGTGVLVVREGLLNFSPEEMELIRSSGEENIGGIAALGKALVLLQRVGMDLIREEEQALTARLLQGMAQIKGLTVYGLKDTASPSFSSKGGVIVFNMKNIMPDKLAKALAERGGIGVRYGCHCAHMLIKHLYHISPFLERFQGLIVTFFPGLRLPGMVRISLGIGNNIEEVDTLVGILRLIANTPGKKLEKAISESGEKTNQLSKKGLRILMKELIRERERRVYFP